MSKKVQNTKIMSKKDTNELKINDAYKYDIEDDKIKELNEIIDKLDNDDDNKKTLTEIIKNNDNLNDDDKLKLKNIKKKINNTKQRYSNKNEKENNKYDNEEDVKLSYSFIYFCAESEKKLLSDNNKIYTCKRCDKKIGNLSYNTSKIILNEIIKNKKKCENYEIDNSMKNFYDKKIIGNTNKKNDYIIYHRIKIFDKQMSNLFDEIKFFNITN